MKVIYAMFISAAVLLSGCAAEVGSPEWCADMEAKPKGEWTANEATEYAKNCILK